ncbi:MAG: nucleotide exchange factor GrpE [Oscillospiraceae bacterium]|nr:nucleotide exchange factor GrpE [Oscillospiraceae bacterium]
MEKMDALAGQLESANDKYLRLAAEYDNYRKRTAKEKETIYQDAKTDTIAKFLEVYDNLERAVSQAGDEENAHKKGMEMIFHQLEGVLEKMGVTIIDPVGETFDPSKHNAVMHIDSEDLGESVVSQVFQKGFLLGEKVIRFASVQVAN